VCPPRASAIRRLVGDDPAAQAALALAEAGVLSDAFGALQGPVDNDISQTLARAERAVTLARGTGDPLAESAALDALLGAQSWAGDTFGSAATARRRIALLTSISDSPVRTHELLDALGEATEASLGAGDLPRARRWARDLADHPLLAEVGDRATSWLLMVDALAGNVDEALAAGVRFREAWQRAGRPARPYLRPAAAGMAMIHGLRSDHQARRTWNEILDRLGPARSAGHAAVFDGLLMLHRGQAHEALERTAPEPHQVWRWVTWIWLHWYVALRTEAAVLTDSPVAAGRVAEARRIVAGNPVAEAMVERAAALLDGDEERLLAAAAALDAGGCPYQSARTLLLAGGAHATRGAAALTALGVSVD
jgi:hypothetical protein